MSLRVDAVLVGAGRVPNIEGLGLEAAGIETTPRGIVVDDYLQTTNSSVYAAGDVCLDWKFTHAADAAARVVIQNALFLGSRRVSELTMPWCTYTDPEIAHVGLYEKDAAAQGLETEAFVRRFEDVDRAVADGEEEGFAKLLVEKGTDRLLGATLVGRHAGESIGELTTAIAGGLGLKTLANVIHPYPTQAEAIKQAADAFNRTRLTPAVRGLLRLALSLPL
jgi:pyruvate/2-oxoglutarate dehydrogenase complex dihydrolipoamide dehydrogenase (E3) component